MYTVYQTEYSNHLDQNIGIIWHKRSMVVNDNNAEYNVSQEEKKQSQNHLRWHYRHKETFWDSYIDMKSRLVGLKQAKNCVSD